MAGGAVVAALAFGLVPEAGVQPVSFPAALVRVEAITLNAGILKRMAFRRTTDASRPGRAVIRFDLTPGMAKSATADCTATLNARGEDRTHVSVDCRFDGGEGKTRLDARWAELLRLQMQEHVDAAIAMRDFDHGRAGADLTRFMLANRGALVREADIPATAPD